MAFRPRGHTTLITGASSGLGAEFARVFAARGSNLVLVARRLGRLDELAAEIRAEHDVTVLVIAMDLARPEAGDALKARLDAESVTIDTLINNAGFGTIDRFVNEDRKRLAEELQLNVATLVDLTHIFLPEIVRAGRGAVVNLASTAAYQPNPTMAVYGASKSFVLNFTIALALEMQQSSVKILALSPGPTQTEFFAVAKTNLAVSQQTPQQVIAVAMRALDARNTPSHVVAGRSNSFSAAVVGLLPKPFAARIAGNMLTGRRV
ncbi:SDR family NAD(P)-dependent oxidoreductase [Humidisolicoccus flavus]|uniref:SDR family NAD(P)-dependent oxidoreductase n=1 Tax=Humidisolicoccus flavus TaxID=3111414 RepID=UPI0032481C9E